MLIEENQAEYFPIGVFLLFFGGVGFWAALFHFPQIQIPINDLRMWNLSIPIGILLVKSILVSIFGILPICLGLLTLSGKMHRQQSEIFPNEITLIDVIENFFGGICFFYVGMFFSSLPAPSSIAMLHLGILITCFVIGLLWFLKGSLFTVEIFFPQQLDKRRLDWITKLIVKLFIMGSIALVIYIFALFLLMLSAISAVQK